MKVLVIGAGAVGLSIAASIKAGGAEVDIIARGKTKEAIEGRGIIRTGEFEEITLAPNDIRVFECLDDVFDDEYDYIVIATKTLSNDVLSEELFKNRMCMRTNCKIVFMQNGMGYEGPFLEYFSKEDIYHSAIFMGFEKIHANESRVTAFLSPIVMGSVYGFGKTDIEPLAQVITDSGMPAEGSNQVRKAVWSKMIYSTTLNPLGAVLGLTYGELAQSEYAHSIMEILIEEAYSIMEATGESTFCEDANAYREAFFEEMIPAAPDHKSSTQLDIENRRHTEIDTLNGTLLYLASDYDVTAPMHSLMFWLIKAMEENF